MLWTPHFIADAEDPHLLVDFVDLLDKYVIAHRYLGPRDRSLMLLTFAANDATELPIAC